MGVWKGRNMIDRRLFLASGSAAALLTAQPAWAKAKGGKGDAAPAKGGKGDAVPAKGGKDGKRGKGKDAA